MDKQSRKISVCVYVGGGADCYIVTRAYFGALGEVGGGGGGVPMSHVDFKKWQPRMSLSHIHQYVAFNFRGQGPLFPPVSPRLDGRYSLQCRLSILATLHSYRGGLIGALDT